MEAKTIGKFITALRKANGMTQKDLAEKLNVSDKTVSRWERDEGSPDLSMIPIIAEIFDVTCDELLRGERKSPAERESAREAAKESEPSSDTTKEELSSKSEKQLKRLLKVTISRYQSQTYISMGISVVGLIVALLCNLVFLKALLGFFLGAIFFASGIVCQAIFKNRAFLSVEDSGLDETELSRFKRNVIRLTQIANGLSIGCFCFTLPLLLPISAYYGLSADSTFKLGFSCAAVFLLAYAVFLYFHNASLIKKEVYSLEEKDAAVYHHNHDLLGRCVLTFLLIFAVTLGLHQAATDIHGPLSAVKGTTFHDYESFIEFMEQDIPYSRLHNGAYVTEQIIPGSQVYYDNDGNQISQYEFQHRTLTDKNGNIVCEYQERNEMVSFIQYTVQEDTVLPITVITYADEDAAESAIGMRHVIFFVLYGLEVIGVALFYNKKKMR